MIFLEEFFCKCGAVIPQWSKSLNIFYWYYFPSRHAFDDYCFIPFIMSAHYHFILSYHGCWLSFNSISFCLLVIFLFSLIMFADYHFPSRHMFAGHPRSQHWCWLAKWSAAACIVCNEQIMRKRLIQNHLFSRLALRLRRSAQRGKIVLQTHLNISEPKPSLTECQEGPSLSQNRH